VLVVTGLHLHLRYLPPCAWRNSDALLRGCCLWALGYRRGVVDTALRERRRSRSGAVVVVCQVALCRVVSIRFAARQGAAVER